MPQPPRVARIDELPAVPIVDGTITWRPVRRTLGVTAFGVNAYTAARAGDALIEAHDETGPAAGRHEELYAVVTGRARFTVDGQEIDAPPGTLVFVPDPESRRAAVAVEDGTTALAIGGRVGEPYRVSAWEPSMLAKAHSDGGEHDEAVALASQVLDEHPDSATAAFNLACLESLAGRREAALEHLRRAIALDPATREWAATDSDLDAIRDDPAFP